MMDIRYEDLLARVSAAEEAMLAALELEGECNCGLTLEGITLWERNVMRIIVAVSSLSNIEPVEDSTIFSSAFAAGLGL